MCGFIAVKDVPVDLIKLIDDISYRGLKPFKGYREFGDIQMAHYSLPFVNLDPNVAIQPYKNSVFVGEIFNYKELGDYQTDMHCAWHTFWETRGGLKEFNKFDGFFTFVTILGDHLFGVTDHLGIKPLYYRTDMEAMASEPDVLLQLGPVTRNELFHSNVLKWGYDPTGGGPWNEIKQLPPGSYIVKGEVFQYWDWDQVPETTNLYNDLLRATELRLGGQRDIAILLSGGLDSTIVHNLITKHLGREVTAIHIDNGEEDFAHLVNPNAVQVKLDKVFMASITEAQAVSIHQTPVDLGSVIPQIAMARKLKELGFHAVLTGDGADELFGGYRRAKEYDSQASDIWCELPYYHLPKLDRTMMRSTVELRSPFLAPSILKHAFATPYEMRNGEKKVLKETFKDIVPQEILDRDKLPLKTDAIRKDPMKQRLNNEYFWRTIYG